MNAAFVSLTELRGGLIVSVQARSGSPLNAPETIAVLARCAENGGAVAVRIEGAARIAAVRDAVRVPVVGIVKRVHPGYAPYITSSVSEVAEAAEAGARIVAFDATLRPRAGGATVADLVAAIHAHGALAMADCGELHEGESATAAGADIVATTLAGYTESTRGRTLPALDLVEGLARIHPFAICEGGIERPDHVRAAFERGASAVVVGTAITNVDALVERFAAAAPRRK